jgi:hypothetical protein
VPNGFKYLFLLNVLGKVLKSIGHLFKKLIKYVNLIKYTAKEYLNFCKYLIVLKDTYFKIVYVCSPYKV